MMWAEEQGQIKAGVGPFRVSGPAPGPSGLRRKSGAGPNQPRLAGSIPNERCNSTFLIHSRLTLHGPV